MWHASQGGVKRFEITLSTEPTMCRRTEQAIKRPPHPACEFQRFLGSARVGRRHGLGFLELSWCKSTRVARPGKK